MAYWYGVTWNATRRDMARWKQAPEETYRFAVQAFFEPTEFLRTLQHWILFYVQDGETRKSVLRQHQRRAIDAILARCTDATKARGLVWHTQGSGKTFTLLTAARLILEDKTRFANATVILVVDRTELEGQLKGWVERLLGEMQQQDIAVKRADSKAELQSLLDADFRGLIISMIHKFEAIRKESCLRDNVYVFIDEAHRSVAKDLGTYMMAAVPKATIIGFTGTPIARSTQGEGTFKIFGAQDENGYLDKYSIAESIADETTLPIKHVMAPSEMTVPAEQLNKEFFSLAESEGITDVEELNKVLDRAVGLRTFLTADDRIEKVSAFIAQHFKENVLPLGYKAFVVAVIAAFLLGDIATAKKDVLRAWMVAKVADPAARIRYASTYGAGLVELHKYKEALGPLNEAIRVAAKTRNAAYPTIAITTKIEALSGLGQNQQALALAAQEMQKFSAYHLAGHLYELHQTRAEVYERMGDWDQAISDYRSGANYAQQLSFWRGLTQVDGLLAEAYLHQGALQPALTAIDEAIEANKKIPDELYFVPRDLGIKAKILARMGKVKASNDLYEKSADLLDAQLSRAPTPMIERRLLNDLSFVYAGYFASLRDQGRLSDAFRAIERARGRIEAQALSHHDIIMPHAPSAAEMQLTRLNMQLLDTDDPAARGHVLDAIYATEQQIGASERPEDDVSPEPISLIRLQGDLYPSELFVEYVLGEPHSYVLAVTHNTVHCYTLPSKSELEQEASKYRSELVQKAADLPLAQRLFDGLLGEVPEFRMKQSLIVVPDGNLHLLPFEALANSGKYIVASHIVSVAPSGTVLDSLRHRASQQPRTDLPYLGVAAWISKSPPVTLFATIRRSFAGLSRRELVALPESRNEVETIATDLPQPSTILLGGRATETNFKRLPLGQFKVIHLALHGYTDSEFPDRSALVFAPEKPAIDDGLLQVREIRQLHLNASLVTLSACDTGIGPVGEEGVANIVNAFIDAGTQSVVSTLWEIDDRATAHLMIDFYKQLGRGEGKAEALHHAQLDMIKSGAPPYFWAGFELDGEPDGSLFPATRIHSSLRSNQ